MIRSIVKRFRVVEIGLLSLDGPAPEVWHTRTGPGFGVRPVLVEAKINGREPAPLLLDSGVGAVVFDRAYSHEILQRIEAPGDDANASKAQPFVIKSLRIGDAEFNNALSVVLDPSDLCEYAGVSCPGILGNNVFQQSRLHLNFKDSLLAVDSGGD